MSKRKIPAPPYLRRTPKIKTPGNPFRHIIATAETEDRNLYLHATKGWRSENARRSA